MSGGSDHEHHHRDANDIDVRTLLSLIGQAGVQVSMVQARA